MDDSQTGNQATEAQEVVHTYATLDSTFDLSKAAPHTCLVNIEQRGNYLHCHDGNHGMRIPNGKVLDRLDGEWILRDIVLAD